MHLVCKFTAARRALDLKMISPTLYNTIVQRGANTSKKNKTSQANPNVVVKSRIGSKITQTMFDAAMNGIISFSTAANLLGISISRLEKVCS